ncbi:MAG TPA: hypothetical protein VMG32_05595 [Anaeromyxobacteraceae bacterium]|nr:hypothetical protein [Anaeromyxobacteraceae bacterium]
MFLLFCVIGVLAGLVHNLLPGERHVRMSAYALGLAGAWFGGYCAAAFLGGTFVTLGPVTLVGSALGAAVHILAFELIARSVVRRQLL